MHNADMPLLSVLGKRLASLLGWIRKPTSERFSLSIRGSKSRSYPQVSVYPNLTLRKSAPVDTCHIHGTGTPLRGSLAFLTHEPFHVFRYRFVDAPE